MAWKGPQISEKMGLIGFSQVKNLCNYFFTAPIQSKKQTANLKL